MQRGLAGRSVLIVVSSLLLGGGLVQGATKPGLRILSCAGAVEQGGKTYGGCPPLKMTGAIATNLVSSGDLLHFISNGLTIETYRVSTTGKFTRVGCYGREYVTAGGGPNPGLTPTGCTPGPQEPTVPAASYAWFGIDVVAGPGKAVYVASEHSLRGSFTAGKVESLTEADDGSLRRLSCIALATGNDEGSPCTIVKNLGRPGRLAAAPDGKRVYTLTNYGVWSIDRAGDGRLSAVGCVHFMIATCGPNDAGELDASYQRITVSPDSRFVYVDGTVPQGKDFERDVVYVYAATPAAPGLRLVQKQLLPRTFNGARDLLLSRDGTVLYAVGRDGVVGLARSPASGQLSTVRACLANGLSRRGDEGYVSGCQKFPLSSESQALGSALARLPNGSLVLVAEGGAWVLTHDPKRKGFAIKACATNLGAPLCPGPVKTFQYPPKDVAVMANGTIVLSNDYALFAAAATSISAPGGVRPPSEAVPKLCSLVTAGEAAKALSDPAVDSVAWPRWCEYSNPHGEGPKKLLVTWSPNRRLSDSRYRQQIKLYFPNGTQFKGIGDAAAGGIGGDGEAHMIVFAKHRMLETQLCCFGKAGLDRLKTVTVLAVKRLPS